MNAKPLPCPFCGIDLRLDDKDVVHYWWHPFPSPENRVCPGRSVRFEQYPERDDAAIAAWDRRTPTDNLEAGAGDLVAEWGYANTVGNLIAQLRTLPPEMPIHGAFHADYKGGRQAFIRGLTLSRERVNGRKIETGNENVPYSAVMWSAPEQDPNEAAAQLAAVTAERDRCHARLEIDHFWVMGENDDSDLERREVPLEHRDTQIDGIECRDATIACLEQDLAAVTAENARLREALTDIRDATDADNPESYRSDDREGCLDTVHAIAARTALSLMDSKGVDGNKPS